MTTGASGTGAAGRSPSATGGAGAPATTAGTGASMAGVGGPDVTEAGTGAMAGTGGEAGASGMGAAGTGGPTDVPPGFPTEASCLKDITEFDKQGPFEYSTAHSGSVKIWVPKVPAGCKVPIVHLANGTGATCSAYQMVLNRFASHGFLTACYENTNTGAGTQGVTAFETVMKNHPDLYLTRLGSTGHSQGGQASFAVLALSEQKWGLEEFVYAGLAMQPASGFGTQPAGGWRPLYGKIKSPMFAFSGTADMLVSQGWVQQGYDALDDSIEAYHWSAVGATHIPTPQASTMQVGVAWWRWKLLNDQKACEYFKKLPDGNQWNVVKEQNVKPCM